MDEVKGRRRKRWLSALLLAFALVLGLLSVSLAGRGPLQNDFVEYWAAARVLLAGGNPYSPEAILAAEVPSGFAGQRPLLMWNPPWTLPFLLPFGALSYSKASAAWLVLNLAIVFACADFLWREYGGDTRRRWLGWVLAASFFPLLTALGLGQIGPLILLGLTLFLRYHTSRPLLAGAATLLIAVKPQLLYLFWLILLLDCLRRRNWRLLASAVAALLLASLLPLLLNPRLWRDYLDLAGSGEVLRNPSPNFGTLLRMQWGNHAWLQYVPMIFGMAWLAPFWRTRRACWSWGEELPLVLLVSLVTTAYGWLFDQIVLLPAIMQLAAPLGRRARRLRLQAVAAYSAASALMIFFVVLRKTGTSYTWTAPAWLVLYSWLRREIGQHPATSPAALPQPGRVVATGAKQNAR
ncbi:MAG TPA: glycosyltransferase family 87 protein [Terriglobales bacterium]|nr:glycosyltransferase family 87 protein [Terriglobales bacterium]